MENIFHTAIIGAGASGLFCAGSFNARKIILDHNATPGRKVAISGGGRCNFSNLHLSSADYLCQQKHFCKNALAAFTPQHFLHLLEEEHIVYQERENGCLFAQDAQDIVHFLVKRAKKNQTEFSLSTQVLSIRQQKEGGFLLHTSKGSLYAHHVVLASGGLSYPSLGASPFGIHIAQQLGISSIEQRPALCGFTLPKAQQNAFRHLAGNSLCATVTIGCKTFTGQLLFTHEGFSGPSILNASLFWIPSKEVAINFLPGINVQEILMASKNSTRTFSAVLAEYIPVKISKTILGPLEQSLANAPKKDLQAATDRLNHFSFIPAGTSGYTKAEVTAGGIDTREINPTTFEAKNRPGLYIIGELLDVTGRLGGFNLHWCWVSAHSCACALSRTF